MCQQVAQRLERNKYKIPYFLWEYWNTRKFYIQYFIEEPLKSALICTDSFSSVPFITNHNSHSFYATSVKNFTKHFQKISRFADDTA